MSRARKGQGSFYKESHPTRLTKWRGEKWVRLPDGMHRRVIVRGRTLDEAEQRMAAREAALQRAHPDAERQTAQQFMEAWLEHQKLRVKTSSYMESKRLVDRASASFGHIPLAHVSPRHIQAAVDEALAEGKAATADALRRAVKRAMRHAVRLELLTRNPAESIPVVSVPVTRRAIWQPEQAERFMAIARAKAHGGYFALFYAALFTGMRIGELVALEWGDVSPDGVTVRQTVTKSGVGPPKTAAGYRRIPIAERVYSTVAEARAALPKSAWAFPSRVGGRLSVRNVQRKFSRMLVKAELSSMRFHDIRRTTASWWAAAGVSPRVIQALLGHSTPALALAVYTDVMEGQVQGAALMPSFDLPRVEGGGSFGGNGAVPDVIQRDDERDGQGREKRV